MGGTGNFLYANLYANGKLFATYLNSDSQTDFHFSDSGASTSIRCSVLARRISPHYRLFSRAPFAKRAVVHGGVYAQIAGEKIGVRSL